MKRSQRASTLREGASRAVWWIGVAVWLVSATLPGVGWASCEDEAAFRKSLDGQDVAVQTLTAGCTGVCPAYDSACVGACIDQAVHVVVERNREVSRYALAACERQEAGRAALRAAMDLYALALLGLAGFQVGLVTWLHLSADRSSKFLQQLLQEVVAGVRRIEEAMPVKGIERLAELAATLEELAATLKETSSPADGAAQAAASKFEEVKRAADATKRSFEEVRGAAEKLKTALESNPAGDAPADDKAPESSLGTALKMGAGLATIGSFAMEIARLYLDWL